MNRALNGGIKVFWFMGKDDFERYLNKKLKDASFRKEWEEGEAEHQLVKAMIQARIDSGISQHSFQKEIERGEGNPSVETLNRIAKAMGKKLVISFS